MNAGKIQSLKERGFAVVATLVVMTLLALTVLGLVSLSAIQLRLSGPMLDQVRAKANARMALVQAIGQLQKTLGPDRRVSAPAEILGDDVAQPHWTGVWKSKPPTGDDWLTRDDLDGGLRDSRGSDKRNPAASTVAWLVSGEGAPAAGPTGATIELLGAGKSGNKPVQVQTIPVAGEAKKVSGHFAWWTGDLGIRANVAVPDAHAGDAIQPNAPDQNAYARILASQRIDESVVAGAKEVPEASRPLLASDGSLAAGVKDRPWADSHYLDFTSSSAGVLVDVNHGGLKKDLTAYLESDGTIVAKGGQKGLSDEDLLAGNEPGGSDSGRYARTGPRFGLLRKWARANIPFSGSEIPAVLPETVPGDKAESQKLALSNEVPIKMEGNRIPSLQPVLVEATNYTQISTYSIGPATFQLRTMLYPRVVLWNPYNVNLQTQRSVIVIQGNGRQEMWTESRGPGNTVMQQQWLNFEGGRSTSFNLFGDRANDPGYNDPYIGSYYFSIPATKFEPGECLVFSPAKAAEYDGLSAYRPGRYNLAANELSCKVSPDPSRTYYVSASDIDGGFNFLPISFWYSPTPAWSTGGRNGVENQGDDTRAIWKSLPEGTGDVTFEIFDTLPQLCVLSSSLQYGAGKEPRIAWSKNEHMPMELLKEFGPRPTLIPNVRTREGLRMRWFEEHPSNLLGSGGLKNTPHFQEAMIATWNPRAAFNVRSPWENVAGSLPTSGSAGGPWFFGAYTRDLYDQAVSWPEEAPVPSGGVYHGNPFGQPQEGQPKIVLFDVPRTETGIISLGQFQHAQLSDFIWHPSYAVGNSLVDPRLGSSLDRTAAISSSTEGSAKAGFTKDAIGWSNDKQRSDSQDAWAINGRAILQDVPETDNLVYDLSYEVNRTLWDRYYLSSGTADEKAAFLKNPADQALPNGRMRLAPGTATADDLGDFHQSAAHLMVAGAFNVNSTRTDAWKALLASTRKTAFGGSKGTPFPRVLDPPGKEWTADSSAEDANAWSGYRSLSDEEIDRLATEIVKQVKLRGPFLSMADFVNRRLANDDTGKMGALQAAIENAGLNSAFQNAYPLDNTVSLPDYHHPDNITDPTRLEQTLKPDCKAWGIPGYLTQADVLQVLGPALAARSDTFVVRAYGDAVDPNGNVVARAWCEAVVQRIPEPLKPDSTGLNPKNADEDGDLGRRFTLVSFRWLNKDEL